jgi:hypothetical protein
MTGFGGCPGSAWVDTFIFLPVGGQISELWIRAGDQPQLLLSPPILQLLFTGDGFVHVVETFPIDQADGVVAGGESFAFVRLVVEDATVEVVCHPDVQRSAGAALHDVDVVMMFAGH